ncbi:hypothetical protein Bca4012_010763 [Brassica carinata]
MFRLSLSWVERFAFCVLCLSVLSRPIVVFRFKGGERRVMAVRTQSLWWSCGCRVVWFCLCSSRVVGLTYRQWQYKLLLRRLLSFCPSSSRSRSRFSSSQFTFDFWLFLSSVASARRPGWVGHPSVTLSSWMLWQPAFFPECMLHVWSLTPGGLHSLHVGAGDQMALRQVCYLSLLNFCVKSLIVNEDGKLKEIIMMSL